MGENAQVRRLRGEIDRVDERILAAIERRLELAASMADAKEGLDQHSPLRPSRERFILDRLKRKARLASGSLIEAVWRELIGHGRQAQGALRLVLSPSGDSLLLEECARRQFSSAVPVEWAATASEALEAARRSPAIAVVEAHQDAPGLIAVDDIRTLAGFVVGYAYARVHPEGRG